MYNCAQITHEGVLSLNVKPEQVIHWVKQAFLAKESSSLPPKISITFDDNTKFFNTMPTLMRSENVFGVKVVTRYPGRDLAIKGDILIYNYSNGELLAIVDGTWITAERTGAVAAVAVENLAITNYETLAIMGLGATGQSFLRSWLCNPLSKSKTVKLLAYKDHAEKTKSFLNQQGVNNVVICSDYESLIRDSDVVVSAITVANELISKDEWFKPGVLLVPIHTRGFQNCDLFFDQVVCDDVGHVEGFKNFSHFKSLKEMSNILSGKLVGRQNDDERIIAYNIGIALHDILIAKRVWELYTKV